MECGSNAAALNNKITEICRLKSGSVAAALIVGLWLLFATDPLSNKKRIFLILGQQVVSKWIMNTHHLATNCCRKPFDGFLETFERDGALWSNNEHSVVVLSEDLNIRLSWDQSQRVLNTRRTP